jgi:DNA-binding transcriptional LysR family regulator
MPVDWDKLRIFHAVADAGSLTHAGETLHLSQSAVSRQIRALEESLSTTLFRRHARGLILTEQGELLFDATRMMAKRLETTAARIRDSEDELFGDLRITTTTGFGTLWLAPRLPRLFEQYPKLKLDLILTERVVDLPMREADVAIRMKEPSQADLVRRKLMDVRIRLYASRGYIERFGAPATAEALREHRLISQTPDAPQVRAGAEFVAALAADGQEKHLTVNNYFGILQMVIHGVGVGVLPDYVALEFPEVVNVLPERVSAEIPVYLAYAEELRHSRRVDAFRTFVVHEIAALRKQKDLMGA